MSEIWLPVVGYEGIYEVSNLGRVRGLYGPMRAHRGKRSTDYPRIALAGKKYFVHVLVASAFLGPRPAGYEVNHIDGDKGNPVLANLEYVTRSQNGLHACRVLKTHRQKGSLHGAHKLIESEVMQIIERTAAGEPINMIAADFGVSMATVSMIAMGRTWKHLPRIPQTDRRLQYGN